MKALWPASLVSLCVTLALSASSTTSVLDSPVVLVHVAGKPSPQVQATAPLAPKGSFQVQTTLPACHINLSITRFCLHRGGGVRGVSTVPCWFIRAERFGAGVHRM